MQLFDDPVTTLTQISLAPISLCVTVLDVWGRQMKITALAFKVLMIRGYAVKWPFNKAKAQPQGQRSGGLLYAL